MISLIRGTQNKRIHKDRKYNRGYQQQGWENGEDEKSLFNKYWVSVWNDEKVPERDSGYGHMTLWIYLNATESDF